MDPMEGQLEEGGLDAAAAELGPGGMTAPESDAEVPLVDTSTVESALANDATEMAASVSMARKPRPAFSWHFIRGSRRLVIMSRSPQTIWSRAWYVCPKD